MRDHQYFVYLLASKPYGTLYVGVTNDLIRRIAEHRDGLIPDFTKNTASRHWSGSSDMAMCMTPSRGKRN